MFCPCTGWGKEGRKKGTHTRPRFHYCADMTAKHWTLQVNSLRANKKQSLGQSLNAQTATNQFESAFKTLHRHSGATAPFLFTLLRRSAHFIPAICLQLRISFVSSIYSTFSPKCSLHFVVFFNVSLYIKKIFHLVRVPCSWTADTYLNQFHGVTQLFLSLCCVTTLCHYTTFLGSLKTLTVNCLN